MPHEARQCRWHVGWGLGARGCSPVSTHWVPESPPVTSSPVYRVLPTKALFQGTLWVKSCRHEAESALDAACWVLEVGAQLSGEETPPSGVTGTSTPGTRRFVLWHSVRAALSLPRGPLCPNPVLAELRLCAHLRGSHSPHCSSGPSRLMPTVGKGGVVLTTRQ